MFFVELIASSFLDLISKQARRNAAVSKFLFLYCSICFYSRNSTDKCVLCPSGQTICLLLLNPSTKTSKVRPKGPNTPSIKVI